MSARADDPHAPETSVVLGFGPMLPIVAAAIGVWVTRGDLPLLAVRLAIIWAALILSFIAGVRRGFGFGVDHASTVVEIATSISYFVLAGLALVSPRADWALALLTLGYLLVAVLDRRAAVKGNAPRHFARLRLPQMALGAVSLSALWFWTIDGGRP